MARKNPKKLVQKLRKEAKNSKKLKTIFRKFCKKTRKNFQKKANRVLKIFTEILKILRQKSQLLFFLIGFALISVSTILIFRAAREKHFLQILPRENLLGFVFGENLNLPPKFEKIAPRVENFFKNAFGENFAEIKNEKFLTAFFAHENEIFPVFGFEFENEKIAENFLQNLRDKKFEEILTQNFLEKFRTIFRETKMKIYDFPARKIACGKLEEKIFCADRARDFFEKVGAGKSFAAKKDFQNYFQKLRRRKFGFFVDARKLEKFFPQFFRISPLQNLNEIVGNFDFSAQKLEIKSFFARDEMQFSSTEKFTKKFLFGERFEKFLPPATVFFARGENFTDFKNFYFANFASNFATNLHFFSRARNFLREFFGDEISLKEDFFEFFAGEFVFGILKNRDPFLVFRAENENFAAKKIAKILAARQRILQNSAGEIVEIKNGNSKLREIFPREKFFEKKILSIDGVKIHEVAAGNEFFAVARRDEIVAFAPNAEILKTIFAIKNDARKFPRGDEIIFLNREV